MAAALLLQEFLDACRVEAPVQETAP
jgi:hypothetical protein